MFTRKLQFYLDAIKFEAEKVIDGIDEEIANMKREIDKITELRLARIKSLKECVEK